MSDALQELASVIAPSQTVLHQEINTDLLLTVCRVLGRKMGIIIQEPITGKSENAQAITLKDIAWASRVRTRAVALKGPWYQHDNGPLLGFVAEDGSPVALLPASPTRYFIFDPRTGQRQIVNKDIAAKLMGIGHVFYRPFDHRAIGIKDLINFALKSCWKRDLLLVSVMGVLCGLLGVAVPIAMGIVFDEIVPEADIGQLVQVAFFLVACAVAAMGFQFVRSLALMRLTGKIGAALQAAVWDRLISLPASFFKGYSAGDLTMRAMCIEQILNLFTGVTTNAILSGLFSIFAIGLLFIYNVHLAFVALSIILVTIAAIGLFGYRQLRYEYKVLEVSQYISGLMPQLIGGVSKFRVAGAESRAFQKWAKAFEMQRKLILHKQKLNNGHTVFNTFMIVVSSMTIFFTMATQNIQLGAGQFIAFNSAFAMCMLSLISLSDSLMTAGMMIPLYQRARPILETLPEVDSSKLVPVTLTGAIEVSHVSFRYKKDGALILQDISFKVNEGEYIALVGASGCGKSTVLRILLGFESPETGKIYYDGQDLSKIDARGIRKQLGVVLQNGQLIAGSIASNIIGANPSLTLDDAWEAARMAGIADDIREMPMGMHTVISEGTGTISGGQKQRLMIARAIINKPRILFFDEATSALDNQTQTIVSKSMEQLRVTRIVIAHRLSTIMNCDRIFFIDQGRIVEQGSYVELMEKQGRFAEMAKRQLF